MKFPKSGATISVKDFFSYRFSRSYDPTDSLVSLSIRRDIAHILVLENQSLRIIKQTIIDEILKKTN